jgi:5-methylcytosine-specific restriction enzyme A
MNRLEFSKKTRLEAFVRAGGHCEKCSAYLSPGNLEYHHEKECTFGGSNDSSNCIVVCKACHRLITGQRAAVIAKSNRQRAKAIGARTNSHPLPFGKKSQWKKKIDGTIVRRD